MVDLSVEIGSLKLSNPIMPASGTFSAEFSQVIDLNRLGAELDLFAAEARRTRLATALTGQIGRAHV